MHQKDISEDIIYDINKEETNIFGSNLSKIIKIYAK